MERREQFYNNISTELLGCFCYYIQRKQLELDVYDYELVREIELISSVARKRNISLLKLYQIGYSVSKNEIEITRKELGNRVEIYGKCKK